MKGGMDMEIDSTILSSMIAIGSLVVAILGFLWARFKEGADLRERIAKLEQSQTDSAAIRQKLKDLDDKAVIISDRLARLETKIELFWNAMTDNAINALHHPMETRSDQLLDKLKQRSITLSEMQELKELLCSRIESKTAKNKDGEVFWAAFMIARLDTLLSESKNITRTAAVSGER
jgi:dsDNA-specific endonuclease/ATPase MutS2